MTDILEALYKSYFLENHKASPEYRAASRTEEKMLDKLLSGVSEDDREELRAWQADSLMLSNIDWFREGFRLGAALMLELL